MNEIMNWSQCESDFVRKVQIDDEKIEALRKTALIRLERAREPFKGNVSLALEDYYEAIKELLTAYMLKFGMRSKNHQCLISFLYMKNPTLENESNLIQKMSFYRNRLDYYGEGVPLFFYERNKEEFEKIIKLLINLIKEVKK